MEALATEATVVAVEARQGWPPMLALQDQSEDRPVEMYLHSRWVPLLRCPSPLLRGEGHGRQTGTKSRRVVIGKCESGRCVGDNTESSVGCLTQAQKYAC